MKYQYRANRSLIVFMIWKDNTACICHSIVVQYMKYLMQLLRIHGTKRHIDYSNSHAEYQHSLQEAQSKYSYFQLLHHEFWASRKCTFLGQHYQQKKWCLQVSFIPIGEEVCLRKIWWIPYNLIISESVLLQKFLIVIWNWCPFKIIGLFLIYSLELIIVSRLRRFHND